MRLRETHDLTNNDGRHQRKESVASLGTSTCTSYKATLVANETAFIMSGRHVGRRSLLMADNADLCVVSLTAYHVGRQKRRPTWRNVVTKSACARAPLPVLYGCVHIVLFSLVEYLQLLHCTSEKNATLHYFCISLNSIKAELVIMSFGIQNPEVTPEKNVTAIPCEMQNFFTWSKLYDFPPKLENF